MWLAVLAGSLTITQGVTGENIGPTRYCWISKVEPYVSSAAILPLVFDTFTFIAITMQIVRKSHMDKNVGNVVQAIVSGHQLQPTMYSTLRGIQVYYL